jgi:HEAT repeat protein
MKRRVAYILAISLVCVSARQLRAQDDDDPQVRELQKKFDELCSIWRKTDKIETPVLSPAELYIARYWVQHEPKIWYSHDFTRMAALTLGNVRDQQSYDQLEKLYLDTSRDPARYEMVRAEAFRAIAKINPDRSAKYVIKELASDNPHFAVYADIVLKEAYGSHSR